MSGIELWWLGQSGFRLHDPADGGMLFVDPFLSEHEGRTWQAPIGPDALAQADAVLCTHEHIDHFDQPALRAANEVPGAQFKLVVPAPIVVQALALGIPQERIIGVQPGQTFGVGGARVHVVPAKHGVTMVDAYSFGREESHGEVRFVGYVIEMAGVRAYHAGDTIPYEGQEETLRDLNPNIALLPINGRDFYREHDRELVGNMDPREAAHLAAAMGAQVVVPMHWEMFSFNLGFPRELVAFATAHTPDLTVLVFGRGQRITFQPNW